MVVTDLIDGLKWWVLFFATGLAFLPITQALFSSFFDRGYIFSKIISILFISYLAWLLSSLHILNFSFLSLFLIMIIFLIINSVLAIKSSASLVNRSTLPIFLFEELIFVLGFAFWSFVRSYEPSVHGLEKFMDFGFINSILRSQQMPPFDIWMTPLSINYYYFGHLVTAASIILTGVLPEIGYNLFLATLFGLTFAASFSIGANLYYSFTKSHQLNYPTPHLLLTKGSYIAGLFSAFLVTLAGNLHPIYAFFANYTTENPVPFWSLQPLINFSAYWYPNATRFIPVTIHEFPLYSFVVADLHGHVLNIPFVLLFMALLINVFFSPKIKLLHAALVSLLIAVFLMTNVLDGPIYLLVLTLFLLLKFLSNQPFALAFRSMLIYMLPITLLAIFFSLPFWISFKPFSSGIGVICSPQFLTNIGQLGPFLFEANHCSRSPLWMLMILWGFFYFTTLLFLVFVIKLKTKISQINPTDYLVLILLLSATILIIIPEIFYVKDIYPAHYRANTVFKFGYQAFIILALVCGYMIARLLTGKKIIALILLSPLLFLVMIYPFFAINSYYGGLTNYKSLDGLRYLNDLYPQDLNAIYWIRQNIQGQPVILEAQGDSYTDYARFSANTGLPTVIGWPVHEWLWRGSYDESGKRSAEVTQMYESDDLNLTQELLRKYNIQYVVIGQLEKQKYLNLKEDKFQKLGSLVVSFENTKIYRLNI